MGTEPDTVSLNYKWETCLHVWTQEKQIEEAGEKLGILHFYFSSLWFLQCSIYPFSCKNVFMAVQKKKKKKRI